MSKIPVNPMCKVFKIQIKKIIYFIAFISIFSEFYRDYCFFMLPRYCYGNRALLQHTCGNWIIPITTPSMSLNNGLECLFNVDKSCLCNAASISQIEGMTNQSRFNVLVVLSKISYLLNIQT